jgi:molecular chaperone GrpE
MKNEEQKDIINNEDIQSEPESFQDLEFVENTEDGEELQAKDVTKKLREDLKICRNEKEEYLTGWQRAKADYINLQKELNLIHNNVSILAKEKITENLLPALDSFEMAFGNKEHWETLDKEWRDGIMSIYQQFISGLKDSGIEKIDQAEVPFDPNIHQSVSVVQTADELKDHTVEKILQAGYKIGDLSVDKAGRIIRPAKVTIYEFKNCD